MSDDHSNLIKSPKQLILVVFGCFFIPLIIIYLLLVYVLNAKPVSEKSADADKSTIALIKPVAQLNFRDASLPREMKSGEEVYKAVCSSCHNSGAAGAPMFNNAAAWAPRISKGYDALYGSVLKGKNAMPARGGASPADVSDFELARSVVYLANSSGGKFTEPPVPAAPAQKPAK